jgi:sensor histidine kinase YesM
MDKNPVLRSYKSKLLYVALWAVVITAQSILFSLVSWCYVVEMLIYNILFAVAMLSLWYPVRFNGWERKTWYFNTLAHLSLCVVIIAGSMLVSSGIMWIVDDKDWKSQFWVWKIATGSIYYLVITLVYYLCFYIKKLNEKAKSEIHLHKLLKDSELDLLKSQINPHFLFNSLNSVSSLICRAPEQAQKMLIALSDYLRYMVISIDKEYSTLHDEIDNIERYLLIEKLRFGDKLEYVLDVAPNSAGAKIPSMLLQPLFENAIKHGVYESLQTVRIDVTIRYNSQYLYIDIRNDIDAGNDLHKKGSGTGLKNIRERLRLLYNTDASLRTKIDKGKFVVLLEIPLQTGILKIEN